MDMSVTMNTNPEELGMSQMWRRPWHQWCCTECTNKLTAQLQTSGSAGQGGRHVVRHLLTSALGEKERRETHLVLSLHRGSVFSSEA